MRITQCNTVLKFFKPHVFRKFGFVEYTNPASACVFWGMYPASTRKLISHKGFAVVVWRGSDAMVALKNQSFVKFLLQNTGRIKHIAISNFIEQDLDKVGIPYISLPITSMTYGECYVMPRGGHLYTYSADNDGSLIKYHTALAKEVSLKTGVPLKSATKDSYSRARLVTSVYRDCFLGLRLLTHDGLSNSVVELGLCGRNVVHNGNLPNSIHFRDTKDIIQIVQHEYAHRKENNKQIAEDVKKFINIDKNWLNEDYWI